MATWKFQNSLEVDSIQPSCSAYRVSPQQCGLMELLRRGMQLVAGDGVFSEQK